MSSFVLGAEYRGGNLPYQPQREYNITHGRYCDPQRANFHNYPSSWTRQIPQELNFKEQSQNCSGVDVKTYDENRVLTSKKDDQYNERAENQVKVPFHVIENRLERSLQYEYNFVSNDTSQESSSSIYPNSCHDPNGGYVPSNSADDQVVVGKKIIHFVKKMEKVQRSHFLWTTRGKTK